MPKATGRCLAVAEQTGQCSLSQESQAAIHLLSGPGQSTSCPASSMGCLLNDTVFVTRGWMQQNEQLCFLKPGLPYLSELDVASSYLGGVH